MAHAKIVMQGDGALFIGRFQSGRPFDQFGYGVVTTPYRFFGVKGLSKKDRIAFGREIEFLRQSYTASSIEGKEWLAISLWCGLRREFTEWDVILHGEAEWSHKQTARPEWPRTFCPTRAE